MFNLSLSNEFKWPVEFHLAANGGKFVKQTFDAVFKRKTADELRELQEREGMTDRLFVAEVLTGWSGITSDGEDVPFSEDALQQVLNVPGAGAAIVQAYYVAIAGIARKN
jgi:hypothetical protein